MKNLLIDEVHRVYYVIATDTTLTSFAPAARNILLHSFIVTPVVITSSINKIFLPKILYFVLNLILPLILFLRCLFDKKVCAFVHFDLIS